MPFELIEGPRRSGFLALSIVAACLLIVGILSVLLLARGVVPALERAGSAAALVARGERLPPLRSRIAEVAELFEGLRRADATLRERRAERDEALDAEKMARHEAERANRLKDEFLMAVSHELRTPLTAIRGWAHMLHTGQIADGQRARAVETIERNARLLAQLVDDLLDVSQGVAGKLRLNLRPTALDDVARAAVETIRPAALAKGLALTIETRGASQVLGDPDRLQQVIWNVVANAVKFTQAGGAVVVAVAGTDRAVDVVVTDNGPGIDVEFLPYAFDPFRQGGAGRVRVDGGLGLGLAIVRQLTELHGGTVVVVNNTPEPGATFRLTFPGVPASV
jgi:signal transduction histidine kinase